MPPDITIPGVNDSKKVTPPERERLAELIKETAVAYRIEFIEAELIDKVGIQTAILWAMSRAAIHIDAPNGKPDSLLIDGKQPKEKLLEGLNGISRFIIKGDSASHSIAAASIIAKVERDSYMKAMHRLYPAYGFDQHKGYGTTTHVDAIRQHGVCPLHRKTFLKKIEGVDA